MPSIGVWVLAAASVLPGLVDAACTVMPIANPSQLKVNCNVTGSLKSPRAIRTFPSTSNDLTACRDACLAEPSCKTFSYDSGKTQCAMYSETLVKQGLRRNSASSVTYWNRLCWTTTCTSDAAASTTTVAAASTTAPPAVNTGDPNATPADPSAFTSTYVTSDGLLPVFTDPVPSLTGLSTATPAPQCIVDPSAQGVKYDIFNKSGIALVYQTAKPPKIGLLRYDQMPSSAAGMKNYKYPTFHFEKPSGAPAGFYDLVIEDPTHGNLYLAREGYGSIYLVSKSSNGQTPRKIDGQTVVTTLWGVSCDGKVTVGTTGTQYAWTAQGKFTTAQPGDPSTGSFLIAPQTTAVTKRNLYQDGDYHRCIDQPRPLVAKVRPGARAASFNGCGSASTAAFVPNLDFGSCCNNHDLCYDDCVAGFKDSCDDSFLSCMGSSCDSDFPHWWEYPALVGCHKVANFYHAVVAGLGGSAFQQSTSDRCQCYCQDTTNTQLCSLNGSPSCVTITGNDNNNCGGCGQTCPSYAHCGGGKCKCNQDTCPGGLCLSLQNHPRNCGTCGNVCASGYCFQGRCYTPPPPSPTSCTPVDAITNGGFDSWNFDPWSITGQTASQSVSGDEGHGPDAAFSSGYWPVTMSQNVVVCPGSTYTLTMRSYSWSGSCTATASLNGHQIFSSPITQRNYDADPLGSNGPGTLYIDPNDSAYTPWGVSRNATITISFSCGGYTTVYADDISFYPS